MLILIGRAIANGCQWGMILYAAPSNTVISPPVILTLGTVTFVVSMLDIMIEFWRPRDRETQKCLSLRDQKQSDLELCYAP